MADPSWGPVDKTPRAIEGSKGKRVVKRILQVLGVLIALGLVSTTAVVAIGYSTTKLPDPNADFQTSTSFVYYNDGKAELGNFAVQNRVPLELADMPDSIKEAMVAAENRTFWTDKGISIRGMIRAAWVIARGGSLQGGSTITQQYIKILYLTSDQTAARKFRELFLAYKLTRQMTKEEILEGYLNTIYFGHGAYGIAAASEAFFDVPAAKLTIPQAAVLASVVNNPSAFDPSDEDNHPRLLERYRYVLQSMLETGAITREQYDEWSAKLPKFPEVKTSQRYGGSKGFLLKMVERELGTAGFSANQINGGGLKITTTFDKAAQAAAVDAAQKYTEASAEAADEKAADLHAAVASVEVGSGEVLALYGGPNYVKNSRNWATTARPAASTFKTYALAAGLEDGNSLYSTFNGNTFTPPGDTTTIRNEYSYQYGSAVNLIKATASSINTAFVDMVSQMSDGPEKVIEMAEAVGAGKNDDWERLGSRIPLGTAEVSPLNQANAYATFANDGTYVAPHVVKEVRDANDQVLYKADPKENEAVDADIARDVTYALSDVVENGTGASVQTLARPVAGKTGTNGVTDEDGKDIVNSAWFVGYTKQISTAVMYVAGDSGSESLDDYARPGDSTFFGGTYPALTWAEYMQVATKDQPVKQFDAPAYVNRDTAQRQTQTTAPQRTSQPESSATRRPSASAADKPTDEPTSEPTEDNTETSEPEETDEPTRKPSSESTKEAGNRESARADE